MITFIEDKHVYLNKNQERYTSVTTVLEQFKPKKDWDKIKKNYAKKNKMTVEEVTEKWEGIKNKACMKGTSFHKFKELELTSNQSIRHGEKDIKVVPSYCIGGIKQSSETMILEEGVYPELIIWMDSVKIAGQADKITVVDGYVHIDDYKTNKKIDKEAWKNWEGIEEKLLHPVSHLSNCNYNIYSLQLSMYMYMILRNNPKLKAGKMRLLHVQFEEETEDVEIIARVEPIEVPYRKDEIQSILRYITTKTK